MTEKTRTERLKDALAAIPLRYVGSGTKDELPKDILVRCEIMHIRRGGRVSGHNYDHDLFLFPASGDAGTIAELLAEHDIEHRVLAVRLPIQVDALNYYDARDAVVLDTRQPDLDDKIEMLRLAQSPSIARALLDQLSALGETAMSLPPEDRDLFLEGGKTGLTALQRTHNGHNDFRSRLTRSAGMFISGVPLHLKPEEITDTDQPVSDGAAHNPPPRLRAR